MHFDFFLLCLSVCLCACDHACVYCVQYNGWHGNIVKPYKHLAVVAVYYCLKFAVNDLCIEIFKQTVSQTTNSSLVVVHQQSNRFSFFKNLTSMPECPPESYGAVHLKIETMQAGLIIQVQISIEESLCSIANGHIIIL